MHILLMTIAVLSMVSGFGFLIAGLGTLSGADEREIAELKQRSEIARQKGWFEALSFSWQWYWQFSSLSQLVAHWAQRPQARKLIYVGCGFLIAAASMGYFRGIFDNVQP